MVTQVVCSRVGGVALSLERGLTFAIVNGPNTRINVAGALRLGHSEKYDHSVPIISLSLICKQYDNGLRHL